MIRNLLTDRENLKKTAVIENDIEISYLDLVRKALALQPYLQKSGQEKVAVFLPDGGDYIAAFWATIMSGKTVFPLNILMKRNEIIMLLKQADVSTVISRSEHSRLFKAMAAKGEYPIQLICIDEADEYDISTYDGDALSEGTDIEKPMVLLATSGTTGKSKIVKLSEKNIEASVSGYLEKRGICELGDEQLSNTRYILAAPFSSVYGIMILSLCLQMSFPIIMMKNTFNLNAFYRTVEKYRVTNYAGSASVILMLEHTAGKRIPYDIQSLRDFGFGGSKVSAEVIERVRKSYPEMSFTQGYGMTEAAPMITLNAPGEQEKAGSVGTAIKGVEIAIRTSDGIVNTSDTEGEILVKGANVMLGYYNDEAATGAVLRDGYLHTGDIGYLDEDGYLYISGRKKSIIIVRGFNVHPEEVEDCILNSMLAKDCLVYGQTDEDGNETVCADVVPINPTVKAEDILAFCGSHLAEYKTPKIINIRRNIRKNPSGKTERQSKLS